MGDIVNDSGARTLIVEDPAQLAKTLEVRGEMADLERIVVIQGYEGRERRWKAGETAQLLREWGG